MNNQHDKRTMARAAKRRAQLKKMRESMTDAAIARKEGISRQRIGQLIGSRKNQE